LPARSVTSGRGEGVALLTLERAGMRGECRELFETVRICGAG
jgi:hypothetical protein